MSSKLSEIHIYRITHIGNVPHIIQYGITHRNSANANPNFFVIGDLSVIDTRSQKQVAVDNGDVFKDDAEMITLGDFISFYFGVKMPMLYVIQQGGNFVEKVTQPEDIVYIACSVLKVSEHQNRCFFSDGHATNNLTTFYDKSALTKLPEIIDWKAIKAPIWGGDGNLNLKRKKQAEFLVSDDVPYEHITGMACYNLAAKEKLSRMGVDETVIKVKPALYY